MAYELLGRRSISASKLRMLRVASLLILFLPSGTARALCLGCPPVAWEVEMTLRDGAQHRGWLVLSSFLVEDAVDFSDLPTHWRGYAPRTLELWTTTAALPWPIRGHVIDRYLPESKPRHERVRLPPRSILLVGAPLEIEPSDVETIRGVAATDLRLELRTRAPVFHISERQAAWIVDRPVAALQVNFTIDDVDSCFWMKEAPPFEQQLEECTFENVYSPGEPGETPVDGLLVLPERSGS